MLLSEPDNFPGPRTKDGVEFCYGMTLYTVGIKGIESHMMLTSRPANFGECWADRAKLARELYPGFVIRLGSGEYVKNEDGTIAIFETHRTANKYLRNRKGRLDVPEIIPYCETK